MPLYQEHIFRRVPIFITAGVVLGPSAEALEQTHYLESLQRLTQSTALLSDCFLGNASTHLPTSSR